MSTDSRSGPAVLPNDAAEAKRRKRLKSATGVPYPTGYWAFRGMIFNLSRLFQKSILVHGERIPQPGGVNYRPKWYQRNRLSMIDFHAFIIAANHGSMLDITFIGMFRRGLVWVCKPFFCMHPLAAIVDQRMGAVPLFRPGKDDDPEKNSPERIAQIREVCYTPAEAVEVTVAALKRGMAAIVFPEGTRRSHTDVRETKNGLARMARRSGCPILPLAIVGCAKGDPEVRTRWLRRRIVVGVAGNLIYPSDFDQLGSMKEIDAAIMAAWQEQLNPLRVEGLACLESHR